MASLKCFDRMTLLLRSRIPACRKLLATHLEIVSDWTLWYNYCSSDGAGQRLVVGRTSCLRGNGPLSGEPQEAHGVVNNGAVSFGG